MRKRVVTVFALSVFSLCFISCSGTKPASDDAAKQVIEITEEPQITPTAEATASETATPTPVASEEPEKTEEAEEAEEAKNVSGALQSDQQAEDLSKSDPDQKSVREEEAEEKDTGEVEEETEEVKDSAGDMAQDFPVLCQYPELPNGCEITSLTMVLRYYGCEADKCDLSDNYLEKGAVGTVSFYEAFEGNPREEDAFGCYAPVIVKAAEKYAEDNGYELSAKELTGAPLAQLLSDYVDRDVPLIVWATQDCREGHYSVTWNVDGQDLTWFTPEHCLVIVGYDDEMIWTADPMYGDVRGYLRDIFEQRYDSLYRQAVVIE